MTAHVVAVIDDFQPKSLDTIAQCLPKDWILKVTASNSAAHVQAAMTEADVIFLMGKAVTAPMVQASQKLSLHTKAWSWRRQYRSDSLPSARGGGGQTAWWQCRAGG
jgi:hypothetical protein